MEFFLRDPTMGGYLDALGISAANAQLLFHLVDADTSGRIELDEFCTGCLRLQGEAKSIDVHTMLYQVNKFLNRWAEFTEFVEERFDELREVVDGHAQDVSRQLRSE